MAASIRTQVRSRPRRAAQPLGGFCRPPGWRSLRREDPVEENALLWRAIVRHVRAEGERLGEAYCEVRYEMLCAEPRAVYAELFRFCGLGSSEAELAGIPAEPLTRSDAWRDTLSAEEIATVEKAAGDLLAELGYA